MFQLPKEIWISLSVMLLIIQSFLLKYPERQEECSVKDKNNYQRALGKPSFKKNIFLLTFVNKDFSPPPPNY